MRSEMVPVEVGQEWDVYIESIGSKGDGVAKIGGFVVFVKGVNQGRRCRVRVTNVLESYSFAEVI